MQIGAIFFIAIVQIFLLVGRQNFTIALVHWFFIVLFFAIVPSVQAYFNIFPLVSINPNPEAILTKANSVVMLWSSIFALVYAHVSTLRYGIVRYTKSKESIDIILYSLIAVLLVLASYVITQRPLALFIRGGGMTSVFSSNIIKLIFQYFCRPAALFIFVLILFETKGVTSKKGRKELIFLSALTFILYNSPLGTARFYAFAVWLSVISLAVLRRNKTGSKLLLIMSGGVFGAEALSGFRGGIQSGLQAELRFGLDYWTSMTFDAYEMLASSVSYTISNGYLYGENILGAFGFFVPRSVWPTKPIGSGAFLMTDFYKFNNPYGTFTNVSCPLLAESFLSLGLFGVAIIASGMGLVIGFMDSVYRNTLKINQIGVSTFQALYFVVGGTFFFMMRGDLLSSWAYLSGIVLSFLVVTRTANGILTFPKLKTGEP